MEVLNMVTMEKSKNKERENKIRRFLSGCILLCAMMVFPVSVLAAPVIFYTDIVSGPKTGGENNNGAYLSIFGKDFGATRGASTVTIGGGEVVAYKVWSDTKVSVQLGAAVATGTVVLTTAGGSATLKQTINQTTDETFTVRSGAFYFVSLSGTDTGGCGAIGSPCRSPNYVTRTLAGNPGDMVIIRGGTYVLTNAASNTVADAFIRVNKSGTNGNPITVYGYPGETVLLQSDTPHYHIWSNFDAESDWVVANLQFHMTFCNTNASVLAMDIGATAAPCPMSAGLFARGRFVNIDISGGCSSLISAEIEVGFSNNIKLLGIHIHDMTDNGEAHSHPIYLAAQQDTTEVGWSSIERYPESRALIQVHTDAFGHTCDTAKWITNISIHNNLIHDVTGQSILIAGGTGDVSIYNNVIYAAPYKQGALMYSDVIALRGGVHMDATLYNNTIYVNPNWTGVGQILGFGFAPDCPHSVILKNNIFVVAEAQDHYFLGDSPTCVDTTVYVTSDYNLWYGSSDGLPVFHGAHELSVDPMFVNASLKDFHLQSGSQAKDAGTTTSAVRDFDGNIRPQGSAFDIGAYEYCGSNCVVSDTIPPSIPTGLVVQ
jgi:hypothetical protein